MYINKDNVLIEYERLKSIVAERKKEFDIFINKLEKETSWLTSPASTKFHLCFEKGLLIHSVGVILPHSLDQFLGERSINTIHYNFSFVKSYIDYILSN